MIAVAFAIVIRAITLIDAIRRLSRRADARAEASETRCGNWSLALGFILLLGLFVHLGVGVLFGLLARRPRGAKLS